MTCEQKGWTLIDEVIIEKRLVLSNLRCLFDRDSGTLAFADLHLGYEEAARQDGVYFPMVQKREMMMDLVRVLERYNPKTVVIDGDIKHTFGRNLRQEWDEVRDVLKALQEWTGDVRFVRGNHDNFIAGILPKGTRLPLELKVGGLRFIHGHKKLAVRKKKRPGEILVLAHEHPSLHLRDKIGAGVRLPCFLWHPEDRILILPAFSSLTKGNDVLKTGFMSPVLKDYEPGEFMVYAVSEIGILEFGRLGDLVPGPKPDIDH
jgi:hypothetical protein